MAKRGADGLDGHISKKGKHELEPGIVYPGIVCPSIIHTAEHAGDRDGDNEHTVPAAVPQGERKIKTPVSQLKRLHHHQEKASKGLTKAKPAEHNVQPRQSDEAEQLRSALRQVLQEKSELESKLEKVNKDYAELDQAIRSVENKQKKVLKTHEDSSKQLQRFDNTQIEHGKRLNEIDDSVTYIINDRRDERAHIQRFEMQCKEYTKAKEEITKEREEMTKKNEDMKKENAEIKKENEQIKKKIIEMEEAARKEMKETEEAKKKYEAMEAQIKETTKSQNEQALVIQSLQLMFNNFVTSSSTITSSRTETPKNDIDDSGLGNSLTSSQVASPITTPSQNVTQMHTNSPLFNANPVNGSVHVPVNTGFFASNNQRPLESSMFNHQQAVASTPLQNALQTKANVHINPFRVSHTAPPQAGAQLFSRPAVQFNQSTPMGSDTELLQSGMPKSRAKAGSVNRGFGAESHNHQDQGDHMVIDQSAGTTITPMDLEKEDRDGDEYMGDRSDDQQTNQGLQPHVTSLPLQMDVEFDRPGRGYADIFDEIANEPTPRSQQRARRGGEQAGLGGTSQPRQGRLTRANMRRVQQSSSVPPSAPMSTSASHRKFHGARNGTLLGNYDPYRHGQHRPNSVQDIRTTLGHGGRGNLGRPQRQDFPPRILIPSRGASHVPRNQGYHSTDADDGYGQVLPPIEGRRQSRGNGNQRVRRDDSRRSDDMGSELRDAMKRQKDVLNSIEGLRKSLQDRAEREAGGHGAPQAKSRPQHNTTSNTVSSGHNTETPRAPRAMRNRQSNVQSNNNNTGRANQTPTYPNREGAGGALPAARSNGAVVDVYAAERVTQNARRRRAHDHRSGAASGQ